MIRTDLHMHSSFSSDSEVPMEVMIEAAIEKGLTHICFTEHQDYHYPPGDEYDFQLDTERYWERVTRLQEAYRGQITVLRGVELGLSSDMIREGEELLASYPFDFVIGSKHIMDGMDPYYPQFWAGKDPADVLRRWYLQMAEDIDAFPRFDSLGHLDYIARYLPGSYAAYDSNLVREEIEAVLRLLIRHDIALEINTNAYRYGSQGPHPETAVIRRYRELGGSLITIGSDAHVPERIGQEYARTEEILTGLGFTESLIYRGHERFRLTFSA